MQAWVHLVLYEFALWVAHSLAWRLKGQACEATVKLCPLDPGNHCAIHKLEVLSGWGAGSAISSSTTKNYVLIVRFGQQLLVMIALLGLGWIALANGHLYAPYKYTRCYPGHGGTPFDANDTPIAKNITSDECEKFCENTTDCVAFAQTNIRLVGSRTLKRSHLH